MNDDTSMLLSLLPYILLSIPFAFGNYLVAGRLGKNRALWLVFSIIPLVNMLFNIWVLYVVVLTVIDHLALISKSIEVRRS